MINAITGLIFIGSSAIMFTVLYKPFFGIEDDFWECVQYALQPDFVSWLNKELGKDYGKSYKLNVFFALILFLGFVLAFIANKLLLSLVN